MVSQNIFFSEKQDFEIDLCDFVEYLIPGSFFGNLFLFQFTIDILVSFEVSKNRIENPCFEINKILFLAFFLIEILKCCFYDFEKLIYFFKM